MADSLETKQEECQRLLAENHQLRELVKMYDDLLIATHAGELPDIPILEDMEKLKSQLGMIESQEE